MSDFADKLSEALENKKNDINSFVWKGPKRKVGGVLVQDEVKLMEASKEQLKSFKAHCTSMLNNKNKEDLGRYTLIEVIRDQENRCNAELYMRYLRKQGITPVEFRKTLVDYLNQEDVKERIPRSTYKTTIISSIIEIPDEFRLLSIDIILDACLASLGVFQRRHITHNFLTKLGLWFTNEETKEYLSKKDEKGKTIDRLEQVRYNLNLRPEVKLHTNYNGGLSYLEFRSMHNLKNERYENMTELALTTLRDKVLPRLEDDVRRQASLWEQKLKEIEAVCQARDIEI